MIVLRLKGNSVKIIFLDVDGVLNIMSDSYRSCAWVNLGSDAVEVHLMKRLEYIIEQTDANIVISSSWGQKQLTILFKKLRFKHIDRIIGRTHRGEVENTNVPDERLIIQQGTGIKYLSERGDQIKHWLDNTEHKIKSYVVLEDEVSDVCGDRCDAIPSSAVIEVDMNEGLSNVNVKTAIEILNTMSAFGL